MAPSTACAPEVLQQIRQSLKSRCPAELVGLLPSELHSLAELICALSEPDGVFRTSFERLDSRAELVALAATRGIPLQPSLLERFERLARAGTGAAQPLSDQQLQGVSAGSAPDLALLGLRGQLPGLLALARF